MRVLPVLVIAGLVVGQGTGCGGDDDVNDNSSSTYFEYYAESINYDPNTGLIQVVGLYRPHGTLTNCTLPTSEVLHVLRYEDQGWVSLADATPISLGEFVDRSRAAPFQHNVEIPGNGFLQLSGSIHTTASSNSTDISCTTAYLRDYETWDRTQVFLHCLGCQDYYCGDGTCDPSEHWQSCPIDCEYPYVCGDGACQGTEDFSCREDCGCTNEECDWSCRNSRNNHDYGICCDNDTGGMFGSCACMFHGPPCDSTEPFCSFTDGIGDWVVICDPDEQVQVFRGCDQLCWEQEGINGYCDIGGTEDCVCDASSI